MAGYPEIEPLSGQSRLRQLEERLRRLRGSANPAEDEAGDLAAAKQVADAEAGMPSLDQMTQGRNEAALAGGIGQGIANFAGSLTETQPMDVAGTVQGGFQQKLVDQQGVLKRLRESLAGRREGVKEEMDVALKSESAKAKASETRLLTQMEKDIIKKGFEILGMPVPSNQEFDSFTNQDLERNVALSAASKAGGATTAGERGKGSSYNGEQSYAEWFNNQPKQGKERVDRALSPIVKELTEYSGQWAKQKSMGNLWEQAAQGNPQAAGSLVSVMARMISLENGVLTDRDVQRVGGAQDIASGLARLVDKYAGSGQSMSKEDLVNARTLINSINQLIPEIHQTKMDVARTKFKMNFPDVPAAFLDEVLPAAPTIAPLTQGISGRMEDGLVSGYDKANAQVGGPALRGPQQPASKPTFSVGQKVTKGGKTWTIKSLKPDGTPDIVE